MSSFERIQQQLNNISGIQYVEAKYPIFNILNKSHHNLRALCAVSFGNDTNPGGIKGFGASALSKVLTSIYANGQPTENQAIDEMI